MGDSVLVVEPSHQVPEVLDSVSCKCSYALASGNSLPLLL